jgi:hypothetical protein
MDMRSSSIWTTKQDRKRFAPRKSRQTVLTEIFCLLFFFAFAFVVSVSSQFLAMDPVEQFVAAFKSGRVQDAPLEGVCGRVSKGNNPSEFMTLTTEVCLAMWCLQP